MSLSRAGADPADPNTGLGDTPPQPAYVGLGANLGDAPATLAAAAQALAALPGCRLLALSPVYRSAPVDAAGPDFFNAVARLDSHLDGPALLAALQAIEQAFGRQRPYRHAPRTLDLDLLLLGSVQCHTTTLTLPHPRLHLRAFVLRPLLDLQADLTAPGLGALAAWLPACADQRLSRLPANPPANPPANRPAIAPAIPALIPPASLPPGAAAS